MGFTALITTIVKKMPKLLDKLLYFAMVFGPLYVGACAVSAYLGGFSDFGFTIAHFPVTFSAFVTGYGPIAAMFLSGLAALTIAREYRINEKSLLYYIAVFMGMIYAMILCACMFLMYINGEWGNMTLILMGIIVFTMGFRPFICIDVTMGVSMLAGLLTYYGLNLLWPGSVGLIGVSGQVLLSGIVAVFLWLMLGFVQSGIEVIAKILNAWPILAAIGLASMAEAVMILMGFNIGAW